jgi:flagellin-specific chaperone FliS
MAASDHTDTPTTSAAPTATGPASEQWLEETLDKVFLTPRIVDERAFEELSGSLKSLVMDANAQNRALIATTGEVKLLGDHLREATRELQTRVETAARVVPTLDQRVAKAEQLLDLTGKELAQRVSELREATDKGVVIDHERIAAQVREQTASVVDQVFQEQVAGLRERMSEAVRQVRQEADEQASAIIARVQAAQQSLDQSLEASEAKARSIAAQLDTLIAQSVERAREASHLADAAQSSFDAAAKDASTRLGAAITGADRRAESIAAQASDRIGELRQKALEVVELAAASKAEDILLIVQDTMNAARQSEAAARELREHVAAAETLRGLNGVLESAGESVDALTLRLSQLRADFEALTVQADSGLETKVRQMGAWLSQLLAQGDQIGRGLDRLIREAAARTDGRGGASA